MAYDSVNKKLYTTATEGISTSEVAACIGDYRVTKFGRSIGMLCTSPKINMWSWVKPIRNSSRKKLSRDDFKGTASDHANNIYYGIKINATLSANLTNALADVHNATFEYIRPTGGDTSPFRLLDFDGYNHRANPNPGAAWPNEDGVLEGDWDDEAEVGGSLTGIYVGYNSNSDGVDFSAMLQDPSVTLDYVLARAYPCLLVTDSKGNSYFTALYNASEGGATPLYYNGTYQSYADWRCKFAKPIYDPNAAIGGTNPWNADQTGMKASVILVRSASATAPMLTTSAGNFEDNWIRLTSAGTNGTAKPALIVGALGGSLALKRIALVFEGALTLMARAGQVVSAIVNLNETSGYSTDKPVTISISLSINGSSFTREITRDKWSAGDSIIGQIISTGITHVQGASYSGTLTVVTYSNNRSTITETDFDITP